MTCDKGDLLQSETVLYPKEQKEQLACFSCVLVAGDEKKAAVTAAFWLVWEQ
jgi:hypothetical protein